MATSFSGWGSRSTQREPPTMGAYVGHKKSYQFFNKQLLSTFSEQPLKQQRKWCEVLDTEIENWELYWFIHVDWMKLICAISAMRDKGNNRVPSLGILCWKNIIVGVISKTFQYQFSFVIQRYNFWIFCSRRLNESTHCSLKVLHIIM